MVAGSVSLQERSTGIDARLLPVLLKLQAEPERRHSLRELAEIVSLSPNHFQRVFKRSVGESPKQYELRLRLERAAHYLLVFEEPVLRIALDAGFDSHEGFSRAFRRRFGVPPDSFRRHGEEAVRRRLGLGHSILDDPHRGFELSQPRIRRLAPMGVAFLRHVGPYEEVSDTLFAQLVVWAEGEGLAPPHTFLGICHDSPMATAAPDLRFDACLRIPPAVEPAAPVARQEVDGGLVAMIDHVGHFDTLPRAYRAIAALVRELDGYQLIGIPTYEFYLTTQVNQHSHLNHTQICLPVERLGR